MDNDFTQSVTQRHRDRERRGEGNVCYNKRCRYHLEDDTCGWIRYDGCIIKQTKKV